MPAQTQPCVTQQNPCMRSIHESGYMQVRARVGGENGIEDIASALAIAGIPCTPQQPADCPGLPEVIQDLQADSLHQECRELGVLAGFFHEAGGY